MILAQGSRHRSAIAVAVAITAWVVAILPPGSAQAAGPNGYPVTNVNLRAGPGTDYPVIVTVQGRAPIAILGCLADYGWCDVVFQNARGWMRSIYLAGFYQGSYYPLRDYAPRLGYRVVSFDIGTYWDSYYRDRSFYGERPRWSAPRQEGSINKAVFYDRLSPYGQWVWLQGQYVWVPDNVGPAWRPYTVGHWVYTDRYGWMWASNEPFGWATYHYGRWGFSNRVGWFWVPGSRWAPAWVSWRSSDDYLAWAPLPPNYDEGVSVNVAAEPVPDYYWQVVPSRSFLSEDLPRDIVHEPNRSRPILEQTRPLGNVTVTNNNVVVNNVVNVQYVEEKTKEPVVVHKVAKTEDVAKSGKVEGAAVEIFQPAPDQAPATAAPARPKKIEDVAKGSKTKEQAGSEATTDEMLVPPDIKKATETKPAAPASGEAPKAGEAVPPPPAAQAPLSPSLPKGEEVSSPPPEAPPGAPAPAGAGSLPPPAAGEAPLPPPPPLTKAAPPSPPAEGAGAPAAKGKEPVPVEPPSIAPSAPTEAAPPLPPPLQEPATPEAKRGGPKVKKDKGEAHQPQDVPAVEPQAPMEALPPPPPPPVKEAPPPPPPPVEQVAPPPPPPVEEAAPPPPSEEAAPKAKKQGKPKKEEAQPQEAPAMAPPAPPPPMETMAPPPLPPAGDAEAPKAKKEGKPKKQEEVQPELAPAMVPPAPPPPPPAEDSGPPKAKNKGKPKQEEEAPPQEPAMAPSAPPPPPAALPPEPASPPAAKGAAPPNGKKAKKEGPKPPEHAQPCPEGTALKEDGSCAPPPQ
jgi:uncharacterized protein YraI